MQDQLTKLISTDLGINDLPVDEQQQLISQFGEVALKAATFALMEKLSPEKQAEFMQLAQGGDQAAVQKFLSQEIPEHQDIAKAAVAEEVRAFKAAQAAA